MRINVKQIFNSLIENKSRGLKTQKIDWVSELSCFLGYIPSNESFFFRLTINKGVQIHKNYLRKFKGLKIIELPNTKDDKKNFTIVLNDIALLDIFSFFLEDILKELISISDEKIAISIINNRVNFWKKLFAKSSGELLNPEQQRGLFGELIILEKLLALFNSKRDALDSWQGPSRQSHDFRFNQNILEVKTTKSTNREVRISSENQLDFQNWNSFYLALVLVNETPGNQGTLSQLINRVINTLNDEVELIEIFLDKLLDAGISNEYLEEYNEISINVRDVIFYRLEEGFPLINRSNIPYNEISKISFMINLNNSEYYIETEDITLENFVTL